MEKATICCPSYYSLYGGVYVTFSVSLLVLNIQHQNSTAAVNRRMMPTNPQLSMSIKIHIHELDLKESRKCTCIFSCRNAS